MPAEKPFSKYYRSRQGAILPLELRLSTLEYKRRAAGMEFRQGNANIRSFPDVRKYLTKVVDDYEERFGNDDVIFEAWHEIRVKVLDNFGKPDYLQTSNELTTRFIQDYFTNPKTSKFSENDYIRVQPVITEITNLVARGK